MHLFGQFLQTGLCFKILADIIDRFGDALIIDFFLLVHRTIYFYKKRRLKGSIPCHAEH
jgi:hypothetical protein